MRKLWAIPAAPGWRVVDEAEAEVWPGVVYLTKRAAVTAIRSLVDQTRRSVVLFG